MEARHSSARRSATRTGSRLRVACARRGNHIAAATTLALLQSGLRLFPRCVLTGETATAGQRPQGSTARRAHGAAAVRLDRAAALHLLGLDLTTQQPSFADIKRAFKQEVLRSHPDLHPNVGEEHFLRVKEAYELLIGRSVGQVASVAAARHSWGKMHRPGGTGSKAVKFKPVEPMLQGVMQGVDFDAIWEEIGYNPYTGDYLGPKGAKGVASAPKAHARPSAHRAHRAAAAAPNVAPNEATEATDTGRRSAKQNQWEGTEATGVPSWMSILLSVFLLTCSHYVIKMKDNLPTRVESPAVERSAETAVETTAKAAAPVVHLEPANGLDYALALSAARPGQVPILIGGVSSSPEVMRAWLAQPEQEDFLPLFPTNVGWGKEPFDPAQSTMLQGLWTVHGQNDRVRYFEDALLAALTQHKSDPADGASLPDRLRYRSVVVAAEQTQVHGIVNVLVDEYGMQMRDVVSGSLWHRGSPNMLADRPVFSLSHPGTEQKVLLIGASQSQQPVLLGPEVTNPISETLPQLWDLVENAHPDLVAVDLSRAPLQELTAELSPILNADLQAGVELIEPKGFEHFQPPKWAGRVDPKQVYPYY